MAETFACGWECHLHPTAPRHFDGAGGSGGTLETTTVRTGTYAQRWTNAVGYARHDPTGTPRIYVGRVYMRFVAFPNTSPLVLIELRDSGGASFGRIQMNTSGQVQTFALSGGGSVTSSFTSALSTGVWYRFDFIGDFTAGVDMSAKIDGTDVGLASDPGTARDISACRVGPSVGATTFDVIYDDFIAAQGSSGDYPLGPGHVDGVHPSADGTHSFTTGDFRSNDVSSFNPATLTTAYTYVDDSPDNNTDYVFQQVVNTVGYIEVKFPASVLTDVIKQVMVILRYQTSSASNCQGFWKLNDGGTIDDIFGGTINTTGGLTAYKDYPTRPGGGEWTNAVLSLLRARYGYSNDISPQPRWQSMMLEVDYRDIIEPGGVTQGQIVGLVR